MEKEGIVRDTIPELPSPPEGEGGLFSGLSPRAVEALGVFEAKEMEKRLEHRMGHSANSPRPALS